MIVVRVELWSAVTGRKTELARMHICNDATGTARRRNYVAQTFVGRSAEALAKLRVSRKGALRDWPSQDVHVWNLVGAMLEAMGYGAKARERAQ